MFGYAVPPVTARETHPGAIPGRGGGKPHSKPPSPEQVQHWIKDEARKAANELDFRRGLLSRLLERRTEPKARRQIMSHAMQLYRATQGQGQGQGRGRGRGDRFVVTGVPLRKGESRSTRGQRGGKYHRRVPKPGGGFRYIYSPEDDEPTGHEARRQWLKRRLRRIIDKAGPEGCAPENLHDLASRHSPREIAELVAELGPFQLDGGRIRRVRNAAKSQRSSGRGPGLLKGLKVAAPGAGGAGGGSTGSPPGTKKIWGNRVVEKQQDGSWKVVSHVAGLEGERVPRTQAQPDSVKPPKPAPAPPPKHRNLSPPGKDHPDHPDLHSRELTQKQAADLINQLKREKKGDG